MKQKKIYVKAQMKVVQLSGKSQLLAESAVNASSGAPSLMHGSYQSAGGVF